MRALRLQLGFDHVERAGRNARDEARARPGYTRQCRKRAGSRQHPHSDSSELAGPRTDLACYR